MDKVCLISQLECSGYDGLASYVHPNPFCVLSPAHISTTRAHYHSRTTHSVPAPTVSSGTGWQSPACVASAPHLHTLY